MKTISLSRLSEDARQLLADASKERGLVVKDEAGRACYGVIPYREASQEEREAAWRHIQVIQREVGDHLRALGRTEEELDQILQDEE